MQGVQVFLIDFQRGLPQIKLVLQGRLGAIASLGHKLLEPRNFLFPCLYLLLTVLHLRQNRPSRCRHGRRVLGGLMQRRGKCHIHFMVRYTQGVLGKFPLFRCGCQRCQALRCEQRLAIHQTCKFGFCLFLLWHGTDPVSEHYCGYQHPSGKESPVVFSEF